MVDFYKTILKAISDYKVILKKTLSPVQRATKMYELGIKKRYVRGDEVELYRLGLKIIAALKDDVAIGKSKKRSLSNVYSGAKEFLQYLENLLANYNIENGEVVHVRRKASCALMDAIQLISFSKRGLTDDEVVRIKQYADVIALHGDAEQRKMLVNVVNLHQAFLVNHLPQEFSRNFS